MGTALIKKNTYHWLKPTQFQPGQSGNPEGKEKGCQNSLRTVLKHALQRGGYKSAIEAMRQRGVDMHDGTHADLIAAMMLWQAEHGNLEAAKEIFKQTEQPLQRDPGEPTEPDPEGNGFNVTINIVKTTNIQNNNIKIGKTKKIQLSK